MITVKQNVIADYPSFMNGCLFHPTDAVEDPWGKRILDTIAADGAIDTVRIYNMLEDIVYSDCHGGLLYDFRLNDLRLDYLIEKGFDLVIAYAAMPDCIGDGKSGGTSVSKGKTRYKGKLFNTSEPSDYALWEEVCFEYTKHIVERYGIERVSKWKLQCFNEPDCSLFFLADTPERKHSTLNERLPAYCKLYRAFEHGIRRVSDKLTIGGPTAAGNMPFLEGFLNFVKSESLKLDYLPLHCYGTRPNYINDGSKPVRVSNIFRVHDKYVEVIKRCGFSHLPLVYDEWGASSHGFFNVEECPGLLFREDERYSAFFVRMLHEFVVRRSKIAKMMICLSGQHEMVTDFSGFRNFFTLNFIKKPIYNAHRLTAMLGDEIVASESENEHVCVVATKTRSGYAAVGAYCTDELDETLPDITETVVLPEDAIGKNAVVYIIDRTHMNPYKRALKLGIGDNPSAEELDILRSEGELKAAFECTLATNTLEIPLSANGVFLCKVGD